MVVMHVMVIFMENIFGRSELPMETFVPGFAERNMNAATGLLPEYIRAFFMH